MQGSGKGHVKVGRRSNEAPPLSFNRIDQSNAAFSNRLLTRLSRLAGHASLCFAFSKSNCDAQDPTPSHPIPPRPSRWASWTGRQSGNAANTPTPVNC